MPETNKKGAGRRPPEDAKALAQTIAGDLQKHLKRITNLLAGTYITPARFFSIVMDAVSRNPRLLQCSRQSILRAVMDCAEMGLEPTGPFGHAYLVPFWNGKINQYEAVAIPGYKGLIERVVGAGAADDIQAFIRHKNDKFRRIYGSDPRIEHEPSDGDPGEAIGVYAVAKIPGTEKTTFEYMTAAEIQTVIDFVKRKNAGKLPEVWTADLSAERMWCKTAIRRLAGRMRKYAKPDGAPRLEKTLLQDNLLLGFDASDGDIFGGLPPMPEDLDGKDASGAGGADTSATPDNKPKPTDIIGPEQVKAFGEAYAKRFGSDETWVKAKLAKIGKDETAELTYQQFGAWMQELVAMESARPAAAVPDGEAPKS